MRNRDLDRGLSKARTLRAYRLGTPLGTVGGNYIQLYNGNASLLVESLEVIQQTSGVILAALQPR
jgi:hypothetical protein